jgi:hypothetical protein
MRKIREALRLHFEAGMSERQIAGACAVLEKVRFVAT